jgi:hypothetical protein
LVADDLAAAVTAIVNPGETPDPVEAPSSVFVG